MEGAVARLHDQFPGLYRVQMRDLRHEVVHVCGGSRRNRHGRMDQWRDCGRSDGIHKLYSEPEAR